MTVAATAAVSRGRRRVLIGMAVAVGAMAAVVLLDVLGVVALAVGARARDG